MADGMVATWEVQSCPQCDSDLFQAVVKLQTKPGGGITTTPAGYACLTCGAVANVAQMQQKSARDRRLRELRALEAEMQQEETPAQAEPVAARRRGQSS